MVRRKRYPSVFGLLCVALLLGGLGVTRAAVAVPQAATPPSVALSASQPIASLTQTPGATPGRAGRAGVRLAHTPLSATSALTAALGAGGRAGAGLALTPLAPSSAITATATPQPHDTDGDGVLDGTDNCPLSPNAEQSDSNNNGLGDPCDAPFTDGFAFVTSDGVIQTRVDDRLRPVHIAAPAAILTLVWSDDASRVEITTDVDGNSDTVDLDVDLSDAALLQAIEAEEKKTGQDLAPLRAWIREKPGRVLAVARGEQPPPVLTPEARSAAPRGAGLAAMPALPANDVPFKVEIYLDRLNQQLNYFWAVVWGYEATQGRHWRTGESQAPRLVLYGALDSFRDFVQGEMRWCDPCDVGCHMDCTTGKGACYAEYPAPYPCYDRTSDLGCRAIRGTFFLDETCPGACWFFTGPYAFCTPLAERDCREIHERSRAGGSAHDIATCFNAGRSCEDPACTP